MAKSLLRVENGKSGFNSNQEIDDREDGENDRAEQRAKDKIKDSLSDSGAWPKEIVPNLKP